MILGGRYGSIEPTTQKSYTQLEYEYAANLDKPLFACVITEAAIENRIKTQGSRAIETSCGRELKDFRSLVLSKMVKFWDDHKDIKIAVGETLSTLARREDLVGWVRASQEANMPALADEIARLSKENSHLRTELERRTDDSILGYTFLQLKSLLESKGLLEAFHKLCSRLNNNGILYQASQSLEEQEQFRQLILIGIIEVDFQVNNFNNFTQRAGFYRLTKPGFTFLNKLESNNL